MARPGDDPARRPKRPRSLGRCEHWYRPRWRCLPAETRTCASTDKANGLRSAHATVISQGAGDARPESGLAVHQRGQDLGSLDRRCRDRIGPGDRRYRRLPLGRSRVHGAMPAPVRPSGAGTRDSFNQSWASIVGARPRFSCRSRRLCRPNRRAESIFRGPEMRRLIQKKSFGFNTPKASTPATGAYLFQAVDRLRSRLSKAILD